FACRLENLTVDCNNVTGSTGVYSNSLNEQCGVYRCLIKNYASFGIRLDQPLGGGNNQNYWIDDVEIYSGSGTGAGAIGLAITNTSLTQPIRGIKRVTINATGFVQQTVAMKLDGMVVGRISDVHIENAVTGILVGSVVLCSGSTFENIIGASNV